MPTAPIPMTVEVVKEAEHVNRVKQGQCTNCWTPVPKSQVHTHPDPCDQPTMCHTCARPGHAAKHCPEGHDPAAQAGQQQQQQPGQRPAARCSGDADEGGATATAPSSTRPPMHRNRQPPPDPERSTW